MSINLTKKKIAEIAKVQKDLTKMKQSIIE